MYTEAFYSQYQRALIHVSKTCEAPVASRSRTICVSLYALFVVVTKSPLVQCHPPFALYTITQLWRILPRVSAHVFYWCSVDFFGLQYLTLFCLLHIETYSHPWYDGRVVFRIVFVCNWMGMDPSFIRLDTARSILKKISMLRRRKELPFWPFCISQKLFLTIKKNQILIPITGCSTHIKLLVISYLFIASIMEIFIYDECIEILIIWYTVIVWHVSSICLVWILSFFLAEEARTRSREEIQMRLNGPLNSIPKK